MKEQYRSHLELLDDLRLKPDSLVVSTDGSRRSLNRIKKTGAGFLILHNDNNVCLDVFLEPVDVVLGAVPARWSVRREHRKE
jgi:hypothetical protein